MTKSQKLRKDIIDGRTKFLHVSVLVSRAPDITDEHGVVHQGVPMRTAPGKGAVARKNPDIEKLLRPGRARRLAMTASRSAAK